MRKKKDSKQEKTVEELDYHKKPEVSSSTLKKIYQNIDNPKKAFYEFRVQKDSAAMRFGRALHDYILMGEDYFFKTWVVFDEEKRPSPDRDYRNVENKAWKNAFYEDNPEEVVLSSEEFTQIKEMFLSAMAHPAFTLISNSERELEIIIDGMKVKADNLNAERKFIADVKKVPKDVTKQEKFGYKIKELVYDLQAAWYVDVANYFYKLPEGETFTFFFFCIEDVAPYSVNCFQVTPETLQTGREKYKKAFDVYNKFKDTPLEEIPGCEYTADNKYGIHLI